MEAEAAEQLEEKVAARRARNRLASGGLCVQAASFAATIASRR